jgi:hypothetical protein
MIHHIYVFSFPWCSINISYIYYILHTYYALNAFTYKAVHDQLALYTLIIYQVRKLDNARICVLDTECFLVNYGESHWHVPDSSNFFLPNLLWMKDMLCANYSTTVIEKIKGKPRSLFCNKHTVIGKMMHINTYSKHEFESWYVKTKMSLLISHRGSSFCPCILHWTYVCICAKCEARLWASSE